MAFPSAKTKDLEPDEIFLDSKNLPGFEQGRFEGRLEQPLSRKTFWYAGAILLVTLAALWYQALRLQILKGNDFRARADENRLRVLALWPARGLILDRNGKILASNSLETRNYPWGEAAAHLLGYLGYPSERDLTTGNFSEPDAMLGRTGTEERYDSELRGEAGSKLTEVDSSGKVLSEAVQKLPQSGRDLELAVDAELQEKTYESIKDLITRRGFKGGAAVIMDVRSGEILSLASYPSFDSNNVSKFLNDPSEPLFNRAISGLYPAGSIIKPLIALAALEEKVVAPEKEILSVGYLSLPNPFNPSQPSIFYDWKAHGWVDMRHALAFSSNVYFYTVGGGFGEIKGLGVRKIQEWAKKFGLGEKTGIDLPGEKAGFVPGPEWKAEANKKDPLWRVGDTYNLSIGQGNLQITPLQMAVYAAAIANGGKILEPHILKTTKEGKARKVANLDPANLEVVREGMRLAAQIGTAQSVGGAGVQVAGKTGTAEIGSGRRVNSWFIGFLPYENPRIAMAIVLEGGLSANLVGAPAASRQIIEWLVQNRPEFTEP